MRLHAIAALAGASAAAMAMSCGDTLPAIADAPDAAVEASADAVVDAAIDVEADVDAGCTSPPCNVEEIANARPAAMAASTSAMVWVEGNTVSLLDPGKPPVALMMPINGATGFLAIETVTVIMTEPTGVRRCPTTGGCNASDPSAPIYGLSDPGPIGIVDGEIFVAERGSAHRVATCGLTANCGDTPAVVAYLPAVPKEIAFTPSSVVVGLADQTIRAYPRAGRPDAGASPPAELVKVGDLRGLAASGAEIYWADGPNGTIGRCTVESCTATSVVTGRAFPSAVAASAGKLYWIETNADSVFRCTLPACGDVTRIARVLQPSDLAVGDRVYIASATEQKIYATPR
jgi:hypothetical protein